MHPAQRWPAPLAARRRRRHSRGEHLLLAEDAEVGLATGLRAAEKLQSILDKRDQGDDVAEMRRQIDQILDAVKSTVPQEMWGAIIDKLDQVEPIAPGVGDETDYEDAFFDPGDCDDIDDAM